MDSTKKGAITSVQAVYVPADDPTDPAPATAFGQLDAFVYLERSISEKGIYPAVAILLGLYVYWSNTASQRQIDKLQGEMQSVMDQQQAAARVVE